MATDSLKFADKDGKDWQVADLPVGLMDEFAAVAAEMYPDTKEPWMHFLLDTIASVCNMDSAVFQMTDIPVAAIDGLEAAAKQCQYTRYSLFSVLLQAAAKNNLVLGRLHTEKSGPGDSVSIIITGIPVDTWEALNDVSQTADAKLFGANKPSAMGVLMILFEFAARGHFKFKVDANLTETPVPEPEAEAAPKAKRERKPSRRVGSFSGS